MVEGAGRRDRISSREQRLNVRQTAEAPGPLKDRGSGTQHNVRQTASQSDYRPAGHRLHWTAARILPVRGAGSETREKGVMLFCRLILALVLFFGLIGKVKPAQHDGHAGDHRS